MANKQTIKTISSVATYVGVLGVIGVGVYYRKEIVGIVTGKKVVNKKAVGKAKKELTLWQNGSIKEHDPKTVDRLREYWNSVDRTYEGMKNEPWSAAFISYIMKDSGAKETFKYSPSHSVYIRDAIKNKKENKGSWKGYRPREAKVEIGDLICYARPISDKYDSTSDYASHCDIVYDVDRKGKRLRSIGGNVSNSVSETIAEIDEKGFLKGTKYFVVLKNK